MVINKQHTKNYFCTIFNFADRKQRKREVYTHHPSHPELSHLCREADSSDSYGSLQHEMFKNNIH